MCECLQAVRSADGGKKAGIGMICSLAIQLIYLILYGYFYLANPDMENKKVLGCVHPEEKTYGLVVVKANTCHACPKEWMEEGSGYTSPTDNYMLYFAIMFILCALQVITSLLMVLANCCSCCGRLAWWPNCFVQLAAVVMLILGSVWRFSQAGRSCSTNVLSAKDSFVDDAIATTGIAAKDKISKVVNDEVKKAMEKTGFG